jgi:hypothetical protein
MFGSSKVRKHLEKNGKRANATVVDIAGSGSTTRKSGFFSEETVEVSLKTTLRVEPEGEPAFEVTDKIKWPGAVIPSAGDEVPVIYDPDDHSKVMLGEIKLPEADLRDDLAGSSMAGILGGDPEKRGDAAKSAEEWQKWSGSPLTIPSKNSLRSW